MKLTITAMDRDDEVMVETSRDGMAAKRKAIKMGGWQVRNLIVFDATAEMEVFSGWLAGDRSAQKNTRYCHYCGRPATDTGAFGEPVCDQCGGRD